MRTIVSATAVALLVLAFASSSRTAAQIQELERALVAVGADAPEFDLPRVGGERVKLSELRQENVVLVNFWFLN